MIKNFPMAIKKFIDDYQSQIDKLSGIIDYKKGNIRIINQELPQPDNKIKSKEDFFKKKEEVKKVE